MAAPPSEHQPVIVELDSERRISRITLGQFPDDLREATQLTAAVKVAYQQSVSQAWDREYEQRTGSEFRPQELPEAIEAIAPKFEFSTDWGYASDAEVADFRSQHYASGTTTDLKSHSGRSNNDCVEVVLNLTDHFGTITVDQGWLLNATRTNIEAALNEAFANAYSAKGMK